MAELVTDRETAVLVPVPAAERVVSPHRSRLDGAAALGVPAHVTVLFPFVPPPLTTPGVVDALAAAVATVSAFGCEFRATSWFGEDVLYLAPRPDEPFRTLTRAVCAAFPGYLPYGGAFADTIPHLTVGERPAGGVADLRAAEAAVLPQLPVRSRVDRVWLMAGSAAPGSWHTLAELPLAPELERPGETPGNDIDATSLSLEGARVTVPARARERAVPSCIVAADRDPSLGGETREQDRRPIAGAPRFRHGVCGLIAAGSAVLPGERYSHDRPEPG